MTFLNGSRKPFCFLVCRKTWIKKKTSYIINRPHPSAFYQFQALALASLQAIRARVKCFFSFPSSLSLILSFISLGLSSHLLSEDWGQLAHELRLPRGCQIKFICDVMYACSTRKDVPTHKGGGANPPMIGNSNNQLRVVNLCMADLQIMQHHIILFVL